MCQPNSIKKRTEIMKFSLKRNFNYSSFHFTVFFQLIKWNNFIIWTLFMMIISIYKVYFVQINLISFRNENNTSIYSVDGNCSGIYRSCCWIYLQLSNSISGSNEPCNFLNEHPLKIMFEVSLQEFILQSRFFAHYHSFKRISK